MAHSLPNHFTEYIYTFYTIAQSQSEDCLRTEVWDELTQSEKVRGVSTVSYESVSSE